MENTKRWCWLLKIVNLFGQSGPSIVIQVFSSDLKTAFWNNVLKNMHVLVNLKNTVITSHR